MMKINLLIPDNKARQAGVMAPFRVRVVYTIRYWILKPLLSRLFIGLDNHTRNYILNPLNHENYVFHLEETVRQFETKHGPLLGGGYINYKEPIKSLKGFNQDNRVKYPKPSKLTELIRKYFWD